MSEMDKLIDALSKMTKAMQEQQAQLANVTSVNLISNFDTFDPKDESFDIYKERLEIHFQLKDVFSNKDMCAKLLLQYVGSSNYSLLSTLAAPKNINDLKYEEIINLFQNHFCPKKNILVEQHKFLNEIQNENQNVTDFVAELQKKAAV